MMTHGGDDAEVDVPGAIAEVRLRHSGVASDYVWPFPLEDIAGLLVRQLERHPREGPGPRQGPSDDAAKGSSREHPLFVRDYLRGLVC
jgi:hypothetical protein